MLSKRIRPRLRFILLIAFGAVFILSAAMLILDYAQGAKEENALRKLAVIAAQSAELPTLSAAPEPASGSTSALAPASRPAILPQYLELHEQNTDMAGWLKIDGTSIDYPVMYAPDDGEFYLSHGFDKEASRSGVPFIDKRCSIEPFGTNTIIYGHHMKNGTMFAGLENYKSEEYCREHPIIRFDTLYARQEYEIIAAFETQVYRENDTAFKHYNFLNAQSGTDFDEYITGIKALALYDTGVSAEYGDELLTLVTCAYHTENGQFVVVAKRTSA